ncbi:hypothetical protein [Hymenobacter latericus]|uniref:hypothetical protein n=1 Tax=Hymenobacter sp. YIM 151858-1 TaxID=2987688 RepID=UPI002226772B|nr:hypothetical protein [Hymenobacter sp. YIM 151858-1]UYZ58319.1 hypothetical protein OIS50_14780 [Hymenobacter sp. YIM 151858-1]
MRYLLALPLLLSAAPALAQTAAVPPSGPLSAARYSPADTLRAVRHLFQQRGKGGAGYLDGGSALVGQGTSGLLQPRDTVLADCRIEARQNVLAGGLMMGYGLFRTQRFGPERYEQVAAAYAQGEPLPAYVRRRLKPKYFRYRSF